MYWFYCVCKRMFLIIYCYLMLCMLNFTTISMFANWFEMLNVMIYHQMICTDDTVVKPTFSHEVHMVLPCRLNPYTHWRSLEFHLQLYFHWHVQNEKTTQRGGNIYIYMKSPTSSSPTLWSPSSSPPTIED